MSGLDTSVPTTFVEDVYLYDLNRPERAPLAFRSARAGEAQPSLYELLELSAREWQGYERRLSDAPICLDKAGGAVVLPVFGSIGRFAVVLKPTIGLPSLFCLAGSERLGRIDPAGEFEGVPCVISERERESAERFAQTVARMRLLIDWCCDAKSAGQAEDCVALAAELLGTKLMPAQTAEFPAVQEQRALPDMQLCGQALFVSLLTLLSAMRHRAHARSGWLYAMERDGRFMLAAAFRTDAESELDELAALQEMLENGGVTFGARTYVAPVKPLQQYAYLHKKITDPHHPYCARCGCLDKRCAVCTAVQWVVLPYVCDAALLGIKNYFCFGE